MKKFFAEICKTEDLDDGTIKVWGIASAPVQDSDGEIVTTDAMKAAMADYMKFGAVREMHQPSAAGTALEVGIDDEGKTTICAHIVDSEAVKKVRAGVYKGFSIGGKVTARDDLQKSTITGIRWVETSLVDRPSNPEAVLTMYKADDLENPVGEGNDPEPPAKVLILDNGEQVTKAQVVEALAKYEGQEIGDAATAIYAMREVNWLLQDELWEAKDGAPEPPEQLAALRAAIAALKRFIISELQEDHTEPAAPHPGEVVAMANAVGDLSKAGAKFSQATKDALAAIHKAAKECCTHLDGLGYEKMDGDVESVDDGGDAGKADHAEDLAKMAGELDLIKADMAKVEAERDDLKKRVAELEAKPAPPKGAVKVVLSKSEDTGGEPVVHVAPVVGAGGEQNDIATMIKAIHSGGSIQH